jgi:hypothetical protein
MQNPTDQAEASIPTVTVTVKEGPRLNPMGTFTVRRRAAKRSERWRQNVTAVLPPSAQGKGVVSRKRPRHGEHVATTTDNASRETASPESSAVGLLLPTTTTNASDVYAFADSVTGTQPNAGAARATGRWTPEEDAHLTSAVAEAKKKLWGKEYKIDWVAAAALVPGRTNEQCHNRWKFTLGPSIDRSAAGRAGKWTEDEDIKLQYSVQMHRGKNWVAIALLVPGRTGKQCHNRWKDELDPTIDRANERTGSWTEEEDLKLKYSVEMHSGKDWVAIATLVPDRTRKQCHNRWKDILDPSIDRANGRTGSWTEEEDIKLQYSVQMHRGINWTAIATLVPGRTGKQCWKRWKKVLDPSIDRAKGHTGKWTEEEDLKLQGAVQTHGGKDWAGIAVLVPDRTKKQCWKRWKYVLDPSIDRANGRMGRWTEDEDLKLKHAVQTRGARDWPGIALMVPGRTNDQCLNRWRNALDPSIDWANGRTGSWTVEEDLKLKTSVEMHGGKDWAAIAVLVPDRTSKQCRQRWHGVLDPSIDRASGRAS